MALHNPPVLNAFRHSHSNWEQGYTLNCLCSTPFGITEVVTAQQ